MLKFGRTRILAFALALMMALVLLPAAALADDAGNIIAFDGAGVTDETEASYLAMASIKPGYEFYVYIPMLNKGSGTATDIACSMPISTDTTVYPFEITSATETVKAAEAYKKVDPSDKTKLIGWTDKTLLAGEHGYFRMKATVSSAVASGFVNLSFNVTYKYDGVDCTDTINVKIYVREVSSSSSGSSYKSKPKVILESYSFEEDTIYAGDTVTLRLVIANTSEREAITNLTLDLSNEAGAILPAPGGSNSIFIGDIEKDGAYAFSIKLQIAPDAEAKSQLLAIKLSYEGTRNRQEFDETASVSVPVQQKARVRINDPVVYDDPWVGGTVSVGLTVYNLGKSPLYNCMVDMEDNSNMTLEESYFGGNVASGSTMRADLSVTPLVGGEITANLRVTYEDVYGNQTEELVPLTMQVNADNGDGSASIYVSGSNAVIPADTPEETPVSSGLAWYWIALIVVALAGATAAVIVRVKKKRERSLEDEDI